LDKLSAFQISEWEAYDKIDPIGFWRIEFGLAKIESLISNIVNQLYHKEGAEPVVTLPTDFMIKWGELSEEVKPKQQSIEEMKQVFRAIADAQKNKKSGRVRKPITKMK
jgi:hypothetical protein